MLGPFVVFLAHQTNTALQNRLGTSCLPAMEDESSLEWLSRVAWLLEARDDEEEDASNPDGMRDDPPMDFGSTSAGEVDDAPSFCSLGANDAAPCFRSLGADDAALATPAAPAAPAAAKAKNPLIKDLVKYGCLTLGDELTFKSDLTSLVAEVSQAETLCLRIKTPEKSAVLRHVRDFCAKHYQLSDPHLADRAELLRNPDTGKQEAWGGLEPWMLSVTAFVKVGESLHAQAVAEAGPAPQLGPSGAYNCTGLFVAKRNPRPECKLTQMRVVFAEITGWDKTTGKPSPSWLEAHRPAHKMKGADWGNFNSKLNSMTQMKQGRRTTQVRAQQRQQHVAAQKSDTNVGKLVEAVDKFREADGENWLWYCLGHEGPVPKARGALKEVLILNRKPPAAADALVRLLEDLAEAQVKVGAVNMIVDQMFFPAANDFSLDHQETMAKFEKLIAARTINLTEKARKQLQGLPNINDKVRKLMAVFGRIVAPTASGSSSNEAGKRKEPATPSEQPPSKH